MRAGSESAGQGRLEVIWHEVECGAYTADLPVWERLAARAGGPALELGCGSGRVSLHLSRQGVDVHGVDREPALVEELAENAAREGLAATAEVADVRALGLDRSFAAVIAPMQLIQLLDENGRGACLRGIAEHLRPGGRAALALVEPPATEVGDSPPLPDVRELDGWVYSSLPLGARGTEEEIVITRLRQRVSPAGELSEERNEVRLARLPSGSLEGEARSCGLKPVERIAIAPTPDHVGSTLVVAEVA